MELNPSELGTREYWDKRYDEETKNYKNHGDPGEIWFGEDSVERVINWMEKNGIDKNSKLIDVGTGNGMFLIELARSGYTNLHGIDYSETAVNLAKQIAYEQNLSSIQFSVGDISDNLSEKFDIIHDKGTYDAVSLSDNAKENRNKYLVNLQQALNDDGIFIITSCNWTKEELDEQFKTWFTPVESIPTPQFKFGGKIGSIVTSVVYKKNS